MIVPEEFETQRVMHAAAVPTLSGKIGNRSGNQFGDHSGTIPGTSPRTNPGTSLAHNEGTFQGRCGGGWWHHSVRFRLIN